MEKQFLLMTCIIVLCIIGWNFKALSTQIYTEIKVVGSLALCLIALRYLTLMIYAVSANYKLLLIMRYFYYASSLGLTIMMAISIWYVSPYLREQIKLASYGILFLPWGLFFTYFLLSQPTVLEESHLFGYELLISSPFKDYFNIAWISFLVVMIILCCLGMMKYKHLQIRVQLFVILLSQLLFIVDGIESSSEALCIIRPFILTEAFALWGIYYALSKPVKNIRSNSKPGKRI